MLNVVKLGKDLETGNQELWFWCPGCDELHRVPVSTGERKHPGTLHPDKTWLWNGSLEKPDCKPSVNDPGVCHFTITDGKLIFAGDCSHVLANKTVEMKPVDPNDPWGRPA
jgi:hypothetical protein